MGKITQNDFIKIGNRYLLKNSNSVYVDEAGMQKIIADNSYNDAVIVEKRNDNKKVVTENEAKPIATDVVQKTVTTKK